jgi:hypothetical protein
VIRTASDEDVSRLQQRLACFEHGEDFAGSNKSPAISG